MSANLKVKVTVAAAFARVDGSQGCDSARVALQGQDEAKKKNIEIAEAVKVVNIIINQVNVPWFLECPMILMCLATTTRLTSLSS